MKDALKRLKDKQKLVKGEWNQEQIDFLKECMKEGVSAYTMKGDTEVIAFLGGRTVEAIDSKMRRLREMNNE